MHNTIINRNLTSRHAALIIAFLASISFLLGGCHSSKPNDSGKGREQTIHVGKGRKLGRRIAEEAMTWIGTPYKYAGTEKGKGTDCSGMVLRVYEDIAGLKLPRNSARQAEFCKPLRSDEVEAGDLVFFATGSDPSKVSHVGIMVDDRQFVHASTRKGVVVSDVTTDYYTRKFMMYGRVSR